MGSLAERVSEQQIKVVSFASNKFVWQQKGDLLFIALVSQEDSVEIYRVLLRDLADQFVSTFYSELKSGTSQFTVFKRFADTVEATLQRFDGIPGLARRYKIGLLPADDLKRLRIVMAQAERRPGVMRGAVITRDGFVLASNLRSYEMEALLDLLDSLSSAPKLAERSLTLSHTSLDPLTRFFVTRAENNVYCIFIVSAEKPDSQLLKGVEPVLAAVASLDQTSLKRVLPTYLAESTGFYEYDLVIPLIPVAEALDSSSRFLGGIEDTLRANAVTVLNIVDQRNTITDIERKTGFTAEETTEVLAHLVSNGIVKIAKLYPVMAERDRRFAAFLEVAGMNNRDYRIVDAIWQYCTGAYSLKEVSDETEIPAARILEVLKSLGKYVRYETERVMQHVR
ncbi:MAG: hypothetical protein C4K47_04460 [Candidatus Thorarchaeota archaeon]|nr:MAG: hypothetical protein C4K47_04460 [Candidatus Thorarchaeota archaeon]